MAHTEKCRGCVYENECSFITCRIEDAIKTRKAIRCCTIDEFAQEIIKQLIEFDNENGFVSIGVCIDIVDKVSEKLKND